MKPTTIYLHIGHGKTGTTAIQSALALSADHLKHKKILYPMTAEERAKANSLKGADFVDMGLPSYGESTSQKQKNAFSI